MRSAILRWWFMVHNGGGGPAFITSSFWATESGDNWLTEAGTTDKWETEEDSLLFFFDFVQESPAIWSQSLDGVISHNKVAVGDTLVSTEVSATPFTIQVVAKQLDPYGYGALQISFTVTQGTPNFLLPFTGATGGGNISFFAVVEGHRTFVDRALSSRLFHMHNEAGKVDRQANAHTGYRLGHTLTAGLMNDIRKGVLVMFTVIKTIDVGETTDSPVSGVTNDNDNDLWIGGIRKTAPDNTNHLAVGANDATVNLTKTTSPGPNVSARSTDYANCVVKDGTTLTYYRDGVKLGTATVDEDVNSEAIFTFCSGHTSVGWYGAAMWVLETAPTDSFIASMSSWMKSRWIAGTKTIYPQLPQP